MPSREKIESLNTLIGGCRSAAMVCRACADSAASTAVQLELLDRADDWDGQRAELQALVLTTGGVPWRHAEPRAQGLRAWLRLKLALFGPSDARALEVCQRAHLDALYRHDHALSGSLPERIRRTLSLQADRIAERTEALELLLEPDPGHLTVPNACKTYRA